MLKNPIYINGVSLDIHIWTQMKNFYLYIQTATALTRQRFCVNSSSFKLFIGWKFCQVLSFQIWEVTQSYCKLTSISTCIKLFMVRLSASILRFPHKRPLLNWFWRACLAGCIFRDHLRVLIKFINRELQLFQIRKKYVLPSNPQLFCNIEGPQHSENCINPIATLVKRRNLQKEATAPGIKIFLQDDSRLAASGYGFIYEFWL